MRASVSTSRRLPHPTQALLCSHPDFGDGLLDALAVVNLPQADGVELALVEVGHGPVPRLLPQGLGRLQSVLKVTPGNHVRMSIHVDQWLTKQNSV